MRAPTRTLTTAALLAAASLPAQQQQQPLQARAAVESPRVYVGQGFLLQIQVQGADDPEAPAIGVLEKDFIVQEAGGGANNSTSLTVVNGRVSQVVRRGYTFNYRLAAKRRGTLTIPPLTIRSGGRSAHTQPIEISVQPPRENDDFKLRLTLSEQTAYVGQPVTLKTTWYVGREVADYAFTMPLLDDRRFEIIDPNAKAPGAAGQEAVEIRLGDRRATARQGNGDLDGRNYLTLQFEKILIPRAAGDIALAPATVTFRAVNGYRRGLLDDFFSGSFFSGGGFGRQAVYETLAVPSNKPLLKVLDLPAAGRPATFSGAIGSYSIEADAEPTEVNVGDPITLHLKIGGKGYLGGLRLPPLGGQYALARDFKIPEEMASGEIKGNAKHFTQTIRAKHSGVTAVPPIALHYFDPQAGRYRTAETEPIALSVKGARIVTAQDAEGVGGAGVRQTRIESSEQGIAHNYVDADALIPQSASLAQRLASPLWLGAVLLPPLIFLGASGARFLQGRASPAERRAKRAYAKWTAEAAADARPDAILAAMQRYLGARLHLPSGALTYRDIGERLARNGIDEETLDRLKTVFERCEAGRYAGAALDASDNLTAEAQAAVTAVEEKLR